MAVVVVIDTIAGDHSIHRHGQQRAVEAYLGVDRGNSSMADNNNAQEAPLLAALDLGSNSFHMIVARIEHGEIRPVERIGEKVQLAAGIGADGNLNDDAIERGLACLARFKQVLDSLQPGLVRLVGTNALRAAKNSQVFAEQAEDLLGLPLEIIAGREEARLIYLGVAHTLSDDEQSRLVVDIGGGSTEFAIGQRFEPMQLESLHMGCVSYMKRFFSDGKISEKRFRRAYEAATLEVLNIRQSYRQIGWHEAVGSAGTLNAISQVLQNHGWGDGTITAKGLASLCRQMLKADHVDDLEFDGLKENRRGVFPSGVAITCALVDSLGIECMSLSQGALREGVVYDMIGRLSHEDVRERTVNALVRRSGISLHNADRVEAMAAQLFAAVRQEWKLDAGQLQLLSWAARLHEVGLTIAHNQFHKHGEYLVRNADLPGFSRPDQQWLALLVRGHRRKFPVELLEELPTKNRLTLGRLCVLLRLAVLFKYVATLEGEPEFEARAEGDALILQTTEDWRERHPLTMAELEAEAEAVAEGGYQLRIV
ncbi:exopolyphosphatase [Porticoccus sp. W117]|uniref:exopolyphosphatase n=1 Tax=Porticoccus sp. W117 TaxID=3054777 RepID=UPI0025916C87|nr:exopolyphosphatase [Porticoccus sp. W117]MDM3870912.1 exopolyphosphatase [Porticoccus sp. W117]